MRLREKDKKLFLAPGGQTAALLSLYCLSRILYFVRVEKVSQKNLHNIDGLMSEKGFVKHHSLFSDRKEVNGYLMGKVKWSFSVRCLLFGE